MIEQKFRNGKVWLNSENQLFLIDNSPLYMGPAIDIVDISWDGDIETFDETNNITTIPKANIWLKVSMASRLSKLLLNLTGINDFHITHKVYGQRDDYSIDDVVLKLLNCRFDNKSLPFIVITSEHDQQGQSLDVSMNGDVEVLRLDVDMTGKVEVLW